MPTRYDLCLEPDLAAATFRGEVTIAVDIVESVEAIVLNATELTISSARLTMADGAVIDLDAVTDEQAERLTLLSPTPVGAGPASIEIPFEGILNDQLRGFYRSSFTDLDGTEQFIATTQFEATDARRAFPCWDEPDFKAVFSVSLVVDEGQFAVSNGAEVERTPSGSGKEIVRYADTIVMSTYLVAFVVGPFEATDPVIVAGVPLRVVAPIGKAHLTNFALEAGAFCLEWLSDYYGIAYPGDKVDFIAVPDFAFGAMENLGAIIYRETALLVDPLTTSLTEQRRVVDVIAHELAHMWFGDLVTMHWWEGIWLNEAFASFMEMKCTEAMHPEWDRWMAFAADPGSERSGAFTVDALSSSRPVEFAVTSPDEANEMFDPLTYGKGSAVLRMMEQYLGFEVFRKGVGDYLRTHSFGNTVTRDLWAALDAASGERVGEIMDTWILQAGFPQVDVRTAGSTIHLSQRRFLLIDDESDTRSWRIPMLLKVVTASGLHTHRIVMTQLDEAIDVGEEVEWLVANGGGHGFYRVHYAAPLLEQLIANFDKLESLERFTILDDTYAFVANGHMEAGDFLHLAAAYRSEHHQAIWQMLVGHLASLEHIVPDALLPAYRGTVADLLRQKADELGWEAVEGEPDLTRLLRGDLLRGMGIIAADETTVARARPRSRALVEDARSIDADVGQASLFITAYNGDADDFDAFFHAYEHADTPQLRQRFLQALCSVDDEELAKRVFGWTFDGTVRTQDAAWVTARLMSNRHSGPGVWRELRNRWVEVTEVYPNVTLRNVFEGLPALSKPDVAADVLAFFAETPVTSPKTLAQKLEQLQANVAVRAREETRLAHHLA